MQETIQPQAEKTPMTRKIQNLRDKILTQDPNFSNETLTRSLIAMGALLSMLLPWAVLDGSKSSLSGAQLLEYAFTSPERGAMFSTSFLGTMGLLFIPLIVTIATVSSFFKAVTNKVSTTTNLLGCLLPIMMVMVTGSITSSDQPHLLGIRVPEWGILMMISCHVILLIHGLIQENDRK